MNFLLETLRLGLANLMLHKLRSLLTALGIIFGVAAVITMVAIGEGNKQRALADIRQLGANNIIVRSIRPPESSSTSSSGSRLIAYGIKRRDLRLIEQTVGPIQRIVPIKQVGSRVTHFEKQVANAAVFGTTPQLQEVTSLRLERGRYLTERDLDSRESVAVLGAEVANRLFPLADPLEGVIRVDNHAFRVVGVLRPVGLAGGAGTALVGRDLNFDVHIPMTTARARFSDMIVRRQAGSQEVTSVELSELYIQAPSQDHVRSVAAQVELALASSGSREDITTVVPLELLDQAQRTLFMFNFLMAAIAAISLLVGGIGIMNIMLASVTERTREIGIRRALGATRKHIVAQFLTETTVLSGLGGVIGVAMGLLAAGTLALIIHQLPEMGRSIGEPAVTTWSILVSFTVAVGVGIVFGLYPAVMASRQDPIVALRHD